MTLWVMRVGLTMRQKCPLSLQSLPNWSATGTDEKGHEETMRTLFLAHQQPCNLL
jgi:hypothetical protein